MLQIEKFSQQAERFSGDKLAANFVTGKSSALQQQNAGARPRRRNARRKSLPGLLR